LRKLSELRRAWSPKEPSEREAAGASRWSERTAVPKGILGRSESTTGVTVKYSSLSREKIHDKVKNMEVRWKSPEFEYRAKDISWYWISIVVAALVLGVAIWQRNFLFGFFVVLAEILVIVWANNKPKEFEFRVADSGVEIVGQKQYPYAEIEAFDIETDSPGEWADLRFRLRRKFRPPLHVLVPKNRGEEVKSALSSRLPQEELPASFFENLERFFGF